MSQYEVVGVRQQSDEEAVRAKWFAEQRLASPDAVDNAARLIIGLVSGMLTLLFGVLALGGEPGKLPIYLRLAVLRGLAALGVLLQLVSLACGLAVVAPRQWKNNPNLPSEQATTFEAILKTKSQWLTRCIWTFGLGLVVMGVVLIIAVLLMPTATP